MKTMLITDVENDGVDLWIYGDTEEQYRYLNAAAAKAAHPADWRRVEWFGREDVLFAAVEGPVGRITAARPVDIEAGDLRTEAAYPCRRGAVETLNRGLRDGSVFLLPGEVRGWSGNRTASDGWQTYHVTYVAPVGAEALAGVGSNR